MIKFLTMSKSRVDLELMITDHLILLRKSLSGSITVEISKEPSVTHKMTKHRPLNLADTN